MKYIDEYRDPEAAHRFAGRIKNIITKPWTIMGILRTQPQTIVKFGIDELLPQQVTSGHSGSCYADTAGGFGILSAAEIEFFHTYSKGDMP